MKIKTPSLLKSSKFSRNILTALVLSTFATASALFAMQPPSVSALSRSDCNDRENSAQCKRDYDKCNDKPTPDKKRQCRQNVLDSYPRKSSGGGGGSAGDSSLGSGTSSGTNYCGRGESRVATKINLGCNGAHANPIIDMAYALIRFLSVGVGIVVIVSVIFAGVSYATSEGNPEKTAQAKSRIQTSIMALVIYLFIFAIIQYLVPGGLF